MSKADWSWLQSRIDQVATASVGVANEVLSAGLTAIDERLGVEVADESGSRNVVITAGGELELFGLVRELVSTAPSIRGWEFIAFRRPVGFEFEVEMGGLRFGAHRLSFQPIDVEVPQGRLAIRMLVPNPGHEEWPDVARQIVEAGLGEEAAASIAHLEVGKRDDDSGRVYALESLPGYVKRHAG